MTPQAKILGVFLATAAMAGAQVSLLNNLTAYYAFDGTPDDGSGHGYALTLSGGATYATGLMGQALDPAGNVNHYAARSTNDGAFNFGTSNFTVQVWVNYSSTAGEQVLVEKFTGQTGPGWSLTKLSNNAIGFVTDNGASPTLQSSGLTITTGGWHQVIARRDGNSLELFFDGVSVAFSTISGATSASTVDPLLVGRRDAADGRGFSTSGSLDELAIWSRPLDNGELASLYNGGAGFALSSIPEPSTSAAWLAGGAAAIVIGRRRRRTERVAR